MISLYPRCITPKTAKRAKMPAPPKAAFIANTIANETKATPNPYRIQEV